MPEVLACPTREDPRSPASVGGPMITAIRAGDYVEVLNIANRSDTYMVLSRCQHHAVGYYCASCRQHLANVGNLTMHLEADVSHDIAVWCSTCRYYQAGDQAQLDALDPHTQGTL
jgi:hypothetical protein